MTRVKEIKRLLSMKLQSREKYFHFLVHMDHIFIMSRITADHLENHTRISEKNKHYQRKTFINDVVFLHSLIPIKD